MRRTPAARRRQRSVRVAFAATVLLLSTAGAAAGLVLADPLALTVALVVSVVCGWAALRVVVVELRQQRRAHAADRARLSQGFHAEIAEQSTHRRAALAGAAAEAQRTDRRRARRGRAGGHPAALGGPRPPRRAPGAHRGRPRRLRRTTGARPRGQPGHPQRRGGRRAGLVGRRSRRVGARHRRRPAQLVRRHRAPAPPTTRAAPSALVQLGRHARRPRPHRHRPTARPRPGFRHFRAPAPLASVTPVT